MMMKNYKNIKPTNRIPETLRTILVLIAMMAGSGIFDVGECWGKVLFLAHYNGSSADADYALGSPTASSIPGYSTAFTVPNGKFGSCLYLLVDSFGRCTYDALNNLDPLKGTVDFWYIYDTDTPGQYHPLFGWYNLPSQPGSLTKDSAIELYTKDGSMTFANYDPYVDAGAGYTADVDVWHHCEINWDCTGGDGNSIFNVYIDGQNVIRKTNWHALHSPGGKIHLGIWDYAYPIFLKGRIDELRITDQVEHLSNFAIPTGEYTTPGTPASVASSYDQAQSELNLLRANMSALDRALALAQWTLHSDPAAQVQAGSDVTEQTASATINAVGVQLRAASLADQGYSDHLLDSFNVSTSTGPPPGPSQGDTAWILGENPPETWTISLQSPTSMETITFSGPTVDSFSNGCWAQKFMGGIPTLTTDIASKTIELSFEQPSGIECGTAYAPVCGLQGNIGPLGYGDWTFFCDEPGAIFSIQINIFSKSDFDRNGFTDWEDFALFSQFWLTESGQLNWSPTYDLVIDGQIDLADFTEFMLDWMW